MNFGQAIEAMKNGKKVCRKGWNGKRMWLKQFSQSFLAYELNKSLNFELDKIGIYENNIFYPFYDFIIMKTADNKVVPWLASQTDVLANDWEIVND